MITITEKGAEKVHEFLAAQQADVSLAGLRVGVRGGGCSGFQYQLAFDEQRENDEVFESHGLKLLVDRESLQFVRGSEDRLRGEPAGCGLQGEQPQRGRGLRLRLLVPRRRGRAGLGRLSDRARAQRAALPSEPVCASPRASQRRPSRRP